MSDERLDVALRYMLRTGGRVRLVALDGDDGAAVREVRPFKETAQIVLLRASTLAQWRTGDRFDLVVGAAVRVARMSTARCAHWLDCLGCGAALDAHSCIAAISAEGAVWRADASLADRPTAFVFAHCAACRNAAHWGAAVLAHSQFAPPPPRVAAVETSVATFHATYESLCAAMHTRELSMLSLHPYARERAAFRHMPDHRALPMAQRRCAARHCGVVFTHGMRYEIACADALANTMALSITALHCPGSAACDAAVRDDARALFAHFSRSDVDVGRASVPHCFHCGATEPAALCTRCNVVPYCSAECESGGWPTHRELCTALTGGGQ